MHLRRRKPAFPEREASVLHQMHGKPQITTGAHSGFYRIVGNHAAYKNVRSPGLAKALQVALPRTASPDSGAVSGLKSCSG